MTSLRLNPRAYGNENFVLESLHSEAIQLQSIQAYYIPRTLVAVDNIVGEDRLSKFKEAYPIDLYIENVEGFAGPNSFASHFGLQIEAGATLVVGRRDWDAAVGKYGTTILPNRPNEGDLIYLPMTKGLFEINFCNHNDPFYQLGHYYTYKMKVELFRYASERIQTGVPEIDAFETTHTTDVTKRADVDTLVRGADNSKFKDKAHDLVFDTKNPFGTI